MGSMGTCMFQRDAKLLPGKHLVAKSSVKYHMMFSLDRFCRLYLHPLVKASFVKILISKACVFLKTNFHV